LQASHVKTGRGMWMEATDFEYVSAGDVKPTGLARAFFLLMKPGIVAAVLLAGFAGMVLAARGLPGARTAGLCLLALLLAAAGSAMLNGCFDAPFDRKMARLEGRVNALDRVGANRLLMMALACIAAALILTLTALNWLTFFLILAAVLSYAVVYTLRLKRRSAWGAVPGGIPGALPVLIGQAAVAGVIDPAGILLFTVIFLWQPPHFWLLALRHQDDYRDAGIPVLPVTRGEGYAKAVVLLYAAALFPATLALPALGHCSGGFAVAAGVLWLYFMIACCRHAVVARRFDLAFRASIVYLTLLLAAVTLDISLVRQSPATQDAHTARSGPNSSFTCSARGTAQRVCAPGL
jgi:protoheme IX farnesyltransferase